MLRIFILKFQKKKEYYGKKYQGYVKVEQISPKQGMFNVEVLIPIFIETEPKQESIFKRFLKLFKKK
ncbi:MAG: hypothetical protein DRI36_03245 [Caldiserica bacterium]|nr:MAG: hypothetical protein DRI36_03245 [Caldisericota bacterium]